MVPGGVVLNIEKGQWHSLKCLESGTVLFEAKDGEYRPLEEDEIWKCSFYLSFLLVFIRAAKTAQRRGLMIHV